MGWVVVGPVGAFGLYNGQPVGRGRGEIGGGYGGVGLGEGVEGGA